MNSAADFSPHPPAANVPYVPAEIGSRLARVYLTLDAQLQHCQALEVKLAQTQAQLAESQAAIQTIHVSHGWKFLTRYYWVRNSLFPPGSWRRRLVFGTIKNLARRIIGAKRSNAPAVPPIGNPYQPSSTQDDYARWIAQSEPSQDDLDRQRHTSFLYQPRISILVAAGNAPGRFLPALLQSVLAQTYPHWELCLTEESGQAPFLATAELARCKAVAVAAAESLAGRLNAALAAATGEHVLLLGADDTLAPFSLFEIVQMLNRQPPADFIYADEDWISETDNRIDPLFKPDWSPETLRGHNYIGRTVCLGRRLIDQVGGFRPGYEEAEHYDLILRTTEQAQKIGHIPQILYHRRTLTAAPIDIKVQKKALEEHLGRLRIAGQVKDGPRPGTFQVVHTSSSRPLISIIIPNKDHADMLARCVRSIGQSTYEPYEIITVENGSRQPETFAYYEVLAQAKNVQVIHWQKPFNFSAINNYAVKYSAGQILLFLNNDMQVINPDWLERMVEHAQRPEVGAVGAMLYYPDETIQHAGMVICQGMQAAHVHRFAPRGSAGYANRLATVQNYSIVTGACLMMRRSVFDEIGGFDEALAILYNDVDLCLRVRQRGYQILWTPHAELYHFESVSRGYEGMYLGEYAQFQGKWAASFANGDPYLNRHLKVVGPDLCVNV